MILSEFILNNQIDELKIGSDIRNFKMRFHNITKEKGNVPSLYGLDYKNEYFEITSFKNTIIGISYDFQYNIDELHDIYFENFKFALGYKTSYNDLVEFLKNVNLDFEVHTSNETDNTEVELKKIKITLVFSHNHKLIKAYIFDRKLHETILKTM